MVGPEPLVAIIDMCTDYLHACDAARGYSPYVVKLRSMSYVVGDVGSSVDFSGSSTAFQDFKVPAI